MGVTMKTARALELLDTFKDQGIQQKGPGLQLVLEYQDCIGRAKRGELAKFEKDLDKRTREIFFWVNAHTLAMEHFLEILKRTYIQRTAQDVIDSEIAQEDARYRTLFEDLNQQRRAVEKDLQENLELRAQIANLTREIARMKEEAEKQLAELETARKYKRDGERFQALRALLQLDKDGPITDIVNNITS